MAEDIGIGTRAGYYDGIGAARDVIQNHLLQLLALTAMEKPTSFGAHDISQEKIKVLSAVRLPANLPTSTARGQYIGYHEESGVNPNSATETYAAIRLNIDNERWAGVPFYLRAGKRLAKRVAEIAVIFKKPEHTPLPAHSLDGLGPDALVFRIQPDEGMTLRLGAKVPGTSTASAQFGNIDMNLSCRTAFGDRYEFPEAYERLFHDVFIGDHTLFPTAEEINLSWEILDPIEKFWETQGMPEPYQAGTWGPEGASAMMTRDGREWRIP
jgi:glucose-6-phosphate 1-dehydrogenase